MVSEGDVTGCGIVERLIDAVHLAGCQIFGLDHAPLLRLHSGKGGLAVFENEGLGANHFSFRVHSNDFEPMIKRLEEHNVKIEFAKKREKSWSLYFYDIDGNKLEATAWPLEDGLPAERRVKEIYDGAARQWKAY